MLNTFGKKQAAFIRNGGLVLSDDYSQIDKQAFEQLAKMNELGFITNDSQSGECERWNYEGKSGMNKERAYVAGFMEKSKAQKFANELNHISDFLGIVLSPTRDIISNGNIPLTQSIVDGKYTHETNAFMYMPKIIIEGEKKNSKIPKKLRSEVMIVYCIDMKWCRKAYSKKGLFASVINALQNL